MTPPTTPLTTPRVGGSAPITVAVVDDHPAIAAGIAAWLSHAELPITVTASGTSAGIAWLPPGDTADVVVLDLLLDHTPTPSYGDLRRLVDHGRKVIVYSMLERRDVALTCLDIGAATYLTKAEGPEHLVTAIVAAARDQPYLAPSLSGAIAADTRSDRPSLSRREFEVLTMWFQCESKKLAADRLAITRTTVDTYLDRVRYKYARVGRPAASKAALLARAIQDGLVDLEDLKGL